MTRNVIRKPSAETYRARYYVPSSPPIVQIVPARSAGDLRRGRGGSSSGGGLSCPNPMWGQLIGAPEPRTPVWRPVYDGGVVARVANMIDEIDVDDAGWTAPRVLHLHHLSDPVGYWTWDTLWKRPNWTRDPVGYNVSPRASWYPFVTFWQVAADLMA